MRRVLVLHLATLFLAIGLVAVADAQGVTGEAQKSGRQPDRRKPRTESKSAGKSKRKNKKRNVKSPTPVSPERAAHVMTFVKRNHPELETLLVHLKAQNKRAYNRAIRDLYRVSEVLISIREDDPDRYDLELKLWKVKSRSMLLATQYRMSKDKNLRRQLEDLLNQQVDLQLKRMRRDRQRRLERLERLDKQIERVESLRKKTVERQFRVLTQGAPRRKPKRTTSKVTTEGRKPKSSKPPKSTGK